jgi:hypothetical protein
VWKQVRIAFLLLILLCVVVYQWIDRATVTAWNRPLWIGIYPLNGDGSPVADRYLQGLDTGAFSGIESFFTEQGHAYGLSVDQPVHIELYRIGRNLPPLLEVNSGPLATMWWSLKLRWYAWRVGDGGGRAKPHIRVFVLYHDPDITPRVPHSLGLQKGLIGVAYAFASRDAEGGNNIVIAHEVMHTLGATDKYDPSSNAPLFPIGYAEPDRVPLLPQPYAEIMAGRRALSRDDFEMPDSLRDVVVGPMTAAEIRWSQKH